MRTLIAGLIILFTACSCAYKLNNKSSGDRKIKPVVEVYATHWCPFCQEEMDFLDANKAQYTVYWVDDEDKEKHKEMHIRCPDSDGFPTTVITDASGKEHCVIGFQKDELEKLLGLE